MGVILEFVLRLLAEILAPELLEAVLRGFQRFGRTFGFLFFAVALCGIWLLWTDRVVLGWFLLVVGGVLSVMSFALNERHREEESNRGDRAKVPLDE